MIIDTNVMITAIDAEAPGHQVHVDFLFEAGQAHRLHANEIIFAELAGRFRSAEATGNALHSLGIALTRFSLDECHRAGHAFREYRRRQGARTTILPDFLIGAQAELRGWPLVTHDRKGFASYFPDLKIIDPTEAAA